MNTFQTLLEEANNDPAGRRWLFVPYDQLSGAIGPLAREDPRELGIVVIESREYLGRRPYHRAKIGLILANSRHFALEQARRGVAVIYINTAGGYRDALAEVFPKTGVLRVMLPAERELRVELHPLIESGVVELVPHEGWLTSTDQFVESAKRGGSWRLDAFYRHVRQDTGLLMDGDQPQGGSYSMDQENRLPWHGEPPAPVPPTFPPESIKIEVVEQVESAFRTHPGTLDVSSLPSTQDDAAVLWDWAKRECLPNFGPYEDAMSSRSSGLFHTRISGLVNLHRLLPRDVLEDAVASDVPLASKEGFVRQLIGWREYVRHVHDATDGFRLCRGRSETVAAHIGDGGYQRWAGRPWPGYAPDYLDGGAVPSALGAAHPLPAAWWGVESGLACLDHVVRCVWREGWSHHITRLMVLSNLATLLDVSPRELTDWFWAAYIDAYDWVVEPNVLGMGTYAVGDLMMSKPYVCGAAYIDRMSDFCCECAFDPDKDCPVTSLYWAFLARHQDTLRRNPRMAAVVASANRRSAPSRAADSAIYEKTLSMLLDGQRVRPAALLSVRA